MRNEFDDVLDGVIYGAAMGAGFGATESFLYVLGGTGELSGGTIASLVVAGLNHAFYMAVFGAILGGTQRLPGGRRAMVTVLGLATIAFLHAFHDTLPMILSRVLAQPDAALGFLSRAVANVVNWLGLLMIAVRRRRRVAARGADPADGAATTRSPAAVVSEAGLRDDHLLRRAPATRGRSCSGAAASAP